MSPEQQAAYEAGRADARAVQEAGANMEVFNHATRFSLISQIWIMAGGVGVTDPSIGSRWETLNRAYLAYQEYIDGHYPILHGELEPSRDPQDMVDAVDAEARDPMSNRLLVGAEAAGDQFAAALRDVGGDLPLEAWTLRGYVDAVAEMRQH